MIRSGKIAWVVAFTMASWSPGVFAQEQRGMIGAGISAGASNYEGEIDDNFTLVFTRPGFGAHATFLFFSQFYLRITGYHGRITASDAQGSFAGNKYRNLSFYSDINEAGVQMMYRLQNRKRGFSKRNFLSPYFFAGIAFYTFNPKRELNGEVYELQKIGTEGQYLSGPYEKPYKLSQWSVPFGAGFLLKISNHVDVGVETGFRKTFTDYLDDASHIYPDKQDLLNAQGPVALYLSDPSNDPEVPGGRPSFSKRGDPSNQDWYVYTNVNVTYYFTTALFKAYKLKNKYKKDSCKGLTFD
ncbi:MAG: hypothetical protein IT242_03490 [Bacteroidia bacterium]|nr:hypothetical protein [Bacteroidia bacterium]